VCCRKKFEQREREAKLFFKSDSDDSGTHDAAVECNGPSGTVIASAPPTVSDSAICVAHGVSSADTPHRCGGDVRVACGETKSLSSVLTVNGSRKEGSDLCLHYSESQDADVKGPEPVTQSAVCDEASNALQRSEPVEEPRGQSMQLPSADSRDEDAARAALQILARRSLPGMGDITKLKPRLSAPDNGVIELDGEEPRAGVVRLMQRFMKHCAVKRPLHTKHNIESGYVLQSLYHSTTQLAHTPYSSSLKEMRRKYN
jgi:hypothetical protein